MTVRVLSGIKRSSSNHGHKVSAKRSYSSENQSSITHTGSPVNPMTAKALASKLNERNSLLNEAKKAQLHGCSSSIIGTLNEIPVPPLISIQTSSVANRFKDTNHDLHSNKFDNMKHSNASIDACNKPLIDEKPHECHTSIKHSNGTKSPRRSKSVTCNHLIYLIWFLSYS